MKSFKTLLEELTAKQKTIVNSWGAPDAADDISKHVYPRGHSRIEIPLENAPDNPDRKTEPDYRVEDHLRKHGYDIHDYAKGVATKKMTVGNPAKGIPYQEKVTKTNIGKVLADTEAPEHIRNAFANDTNRQGVHLHNMKVVISKHPHDVAGASTGRGWTSCMNMGDEGADGNQSSQLENDVKHGTHVAYLVHSHDTDIKNPVARVSLKPFQSEDSHHTILRPEDKVYGVSTRKSGDAGNIIKNKTQEDLLHTLHKWSDVNFPTRPAEVYRKHRGVYDDDLKSLHYNKSQETLDKIASHPDEEVRHALANEHNDYLHGKLSRDSSDYVRQTVARKTNNIEHINHLADDPNHKVRSEVALRGYRSINNKLINDPAASVRKFVMMSGTHPEHEEHWATDKNPAVTRAVAQHTKNPAIAASLLFHDDDETANNAHVTHAALMKGKK